MSQIRNRNSNLTMSGEKKNLAKPPSAGNKDEAVQVVVRCRPMNTKEKETACSQVVQVSILLCEYLLTSKVPILHGLSHLEMTSFQYVLGV